MSPQPETTTQEFRNYQETGDPESHDLFLHVGDEWYEVLPSPKELNEYANQLKKDVNQNNGKATNIKIVWNGEVDDEFLVSQYEIDEAKKLSRRYSKENRLSDPWQIIVLDTITKYIFSNNVELPFSVSRVKASGNKKNYSFAKYSFMMKENNGNHSIPSEKIIDSVSESYSIESLSERKPNFIISATTLPSNDSIKRNTFRNYLKNEFFPKTKPEGKRESKPQIPIEYEDFKDPNPNFLFPINESDDLSQMIPTRNELLKAGKHLSYLLEWKNPFRSIKIGSLGTGFKRYAEVSKYDLKCYMSQVERNMNFTRKKEVENFAAAIMLKPYIIRYITEGHQEEFITVKDMETIQNDSEMFETTFILRFKSISKEMSDIILDVLREKGINPSGFVAQDKEDPSYSVISASQISKTNRPINTQEIFERVITKGWDLPKGQLFNDYH